MTMKRHLSRNTENVLNEDHELFVGIRGGTYYINDEGDRVYLRQKRMKKPSRNYKIKRGAFYRSMLHQIDSEGNRLNIV